MSEVIRRAAQLEVALERIQDPIIREAFEGVIAMVRNIQGDGLESTGPVSGSTGTFSNGDITLANGRVSFEEMRCGIDQHISFRVLEGTIDDGDSLVIYPPNGKIWGVVGWVESEATRSGTGETQWEPIPYGTSAGTSSDKIYLRSVGSNYNLSDRINIANSSGTDGLKYRIIVFYQKVLT